ncbi:hypothetical protein KFK09_008551 [Dendrobium nobile]|uniref:Uncharacterized protein n=1 Tax=Dendrobium nobile TaxID=94219 RepID=A0A8T3BR65_DENNO|nr:hypothetical protein KFK09_008551 [Dendrobium nobile]
MLTRRPVNFGSRVGFGSNPELTWHYSGSGRLDPFLQMGRFSGLEPDPLRVRFNPTRPMLFDCFEFKHARRRGTARDGSRQRAVAAAACSGDGGRQANSVQPAACSGGDAGEAATRRCEQL